MPRKLNKPLLPLTLSTIIGILMVLFISSIIFKNSDQNSNPIIKSETNKHMIPILSQKIIEKTFLDDTAISLIQAQDSYEYIGQLFQTDLDEVDFNKNDVLLTQYYSDGCGLVVDQVLLNANELQVKLRLPKELRNNKELACTAIAIPHTLLIVIPKTSFENAYFIKNNNHFKTTFNKLESPLPNDLKISNDIKAMEVSDKTNKINTTIVDAKHIATLQMIINHARSSEKISNTRESSFTVTFIYEDGNEIPFEVIFDANSTRSWLLKHSSYSLGKLETQIISSIIMDALYNNPI